MSELLNQPVDVSRPSKRGGETLQYENHSVTGDFACLLTPAQIMSGIHTLAMDLPHDLAQTIPDGDNNQHKREIVTVSLFIKDHPGLAISNERVRWLTELIKTHHLEDVRHHAAEAFGAMLAVSEADDKRTLSDVLGVSPDREGFNSQVIDAFQLGKIYETEDVFKHMSPFMQEAILLRAGKSDIYRIVNFLDSHGEQKVDLLELAGKSLDTTQLSGPAFIQMVRSVIPERNALGHADWRIRALAADFVRIGELDVDIETIYERIKTDPEEEVRVRARNALVAKLSSLSGLELDTWATRLLNDYNELSEQELRYVAGVLPRIVSFLSSDRKRDTVTSLMQTGRLHHVPYNRKTAIKSLAKIASSLDEEQEERIKNFIIGSLRDVSPLVQEEAWLSLGKRLTKTLSARQAKKILANLSLDGKDWYYKSIVAKALAQLDTIYPSWPTSQTKPDVLMFPGTFDPIHKGHIESAKAAAELTGREVWIVPNIVLRRKEPVDIQNRLELIRSAIADLPDVFVVPIEILYRDGVPIDTKLDKRKVLSKYVRDIGFLRGADALSRPGYKDSSSPLRHIFHVISSRGMKGVKTMLLNEGLHWEVVEQKTVVSSTQIRELFGSGRQEEAYKMLLPLQIQLLSSNRWYPAVNNNIV
ncbi:adenylyltransferase/cytidyltransferase family protein [Patescibacteria group bacterium]|nr:adenylyltransferase/cytidyltransferase family protein [Patescibacteria group bacterium]